MVVCSRVMCSSLDTMVQRLLLVMCSWIQLDQRWQLSLPAQTTATDIRTLQYSLYLRSEILRCSRRPSRELLYLRVTEELGEKKKPAPFGCGSFCFPYTSFAARSVLNAPFLAIVRSPLVETFTVTDFPSSA